MHWLREWCLVKEMARALTADRPRQAPRIGRGIGLPEFPGYRLLWACLELLNIPSTKRCSQPRPFSLFRVSHGRICGESDFDSATLRKTKDLECRQELYS